MTPESDCKSVKDASLKLMILEINCKTWKSPRVAEHGSSKCSCGDSQGYFSS